ncbi:MAG: hypothetical protein GY700_13925, partial [Propionibacteriaceae bacterium]|nr:hypothetical protein [Propionibacteriaceae bacterium]
YKVYNNSGSAVKGATAMTEIGSTGIFYAALDPSGWSTHTDGEYLIHKYVSNPDKEVKKYKFQHVTISNDEVVGLENDVNISAILAKMPTNYVLGSSDQADHDADFDSVTLATGTHTGAVIPTVSTLTGHTVQTGDSYARLGAPAGADLAEDVAENQTDIDSVLAKMGAIAGSGDNTLYGYIRAMTNKAADLPSDFGGTYVVADNSLEAIRDEGDSNWGSSGTASYMLLVAVNDSGGTGRFS